MGFIGLNCFFNRILLCHSLTLVYSIVHFLENIIQIYFPGLANVSGSCKRGYYCTLGAKQRDPTDGITGNICPAGRYCRE